MPTFFPVFLGRYRQSFKEFGSRLLPASMAVAAIQLILPFVIVRLYSPYQYGKYVLILQSALLCRLLLGSHIEEVISREFPLLISNPPRFQENISIALKCKIVVLLLLCLVGFCLATISKSWLPISIQQYFLALAWALALDLYLTTQAIGRSAKRFRFVELNEVFLQLGFLLVAFGLGSVSKHIDLIIIGYVAMLFLLAIRNIKSTLAFPLSSISKFFFANHIWFNPFMRKLLLYGMPITLSSLLYWYVSVYDRYQVSYALGDAQAGLYAAASSLVVAPVNFLFVALMKYAQPLIFEKEKLGKLDSIASLWPSRLSGAYLILLAALLLSGLLLFAAFCCFVLRFLIPSGSTFSYVAIVALAFAGFLQGISAVLTVFLRLARKGSYILLSLIPSCAFILFFNSTIISNYGLIGAASSSLFCFALYGLMQILFLYRLERRQSFGLLG